MISSIIQATALLLSGHEIVTITGGKVTGSGIPDPTLQQRSEFLAHVAVMEYLASRGQYQPDPMRDIIGPSWDAFSDEAKRLVIPHSFRLFKEQEVATLLGGNGLVTLLLTGEAK